MRVLLDYKEIKPVNPQGNQTWIFFGRTDADAPILWPPDVKSRLIGKDPDAGKDWRQEEKEAIEDEMVGWYHWLNGHEFEQTQGDSEGHRSLVCCSSMAPHSSTLAWKILWTEEPGGLQSMGSLSRTWLSDFTFTFQFHALEKEMATHSSVFAWRIPGTGAPGGLPSLGPHRVGHDWSNLAVAVLQFMGLQRVRHDLATEQQHDSNSRFSWNKRIFAKFSVMGDKTWQLWLTFSQSYHTAYEQAELEAPRNRTAYL